MEPKFTWRGEIQFAGTPEEFNELVAALNKLNIQVHVTTKPGSPSLGKQPMPAAELLGERRVAELAGLATKKVHLEFMRGIQGGIREPHMHLEDEVAFLDHATFKTYVGEVAQALARRRVDMIGDHMGAMEGLDALAAIPIQIP